LSRYHVLVEIGIVDHGEEVDPVGSLVLERNYSTINLMAKRNDMNDLFQSGVLPHDVKIANDAI